uniref:gp53-like domain-containing protein n=1 Tax=Halomonas sp. TaxID=1486246 RepID=UPI002611C70C|nr:phage tail protein [Halomonas sp.]
MASLQITITDAGRAEVINAANNGTAPITITQVGVGTGQYSPDPAATALQAELKRLDTMSGTVVADDTISVTITDESNDAYTVNEFGLYTDNGTLFAVYSHPTDSVVQKSTSGNLLMTVDVVLSTLDATNLTFGDTSFSNPPASEIVKGVIEIADEDEALAGTDDLRAMTPAKVFQAFQQFGLGTTRQAFVEDFHDASIPSGFYNWNETSLNPPPFTGTGGTGGGAVKFSRTLANDDPNQAAGWIACFASGNGADSTEAAWYICNSNAAGEWGPWRRVVHEGDFDSSFGANGSYQKLPGGWIIQRGKRGGIADGDTVTFTIPFPAACEGVLLTDVANSNAESDVEIMSVRSGSPTRNGFVVHGRRSDGVVVSYSSLEYLAIGR